MDWRPHITRQWNRKQPTITWINGKKKIVLEFDEDGPGNRLVYDGGMCWTTDLEDVLAAFQWLADDSK